jgi:hypothetical protein
MNTKAKVFESRRFEAQSGLSKLNIVNSKQRDPREGCHFGKPTSRSLSENSVVGPRASNVFVWQRRRSRRCCLIVDAAGYSQADNSGCLDPPVNKTVQEKGPLEARSSSPAGS